MLNSRQARRICFSRKRPNHFWIRILILFLDKMLFEIGWYFQHPTILSFRICKALIWLDYVQQENNKKIDSSTSPISQSYRRTDVNVVALFSFSTRLDPHICTNKVEKNIHLHILIGKLLNYIRLFAIFRQGSIKRTKNISPLIHA